MLPVAWTPLCWVDNSIAGRCPVLQHGNIADGFHSLSRVVPRMKQYSGIVYDVVFYCIILYSTTVLPRSCHAGAQRPSEGPPGVWGCRKPGSPGSGSPLNRKCPRLRGSMEVCGVESTLRILRSKTRRIPETTVCSFLVFMYHTLYTSYRIIGYMLYTIYNIPCTTWLVFGAPSHGRAGLD